MLFFPEAIT